MALAVAAEFGTTRVSYEAHGDALRLDLVLSDRRWHEQSSLELREAARSALAASEAQQLALPDTIRVHFEKRSMLGTGTSGYGFAVGEL